MTTPIVAMGLSAAQTRALTPKARTLTKDDLNELKGPQAALVSARLGLTVNDIKSIRTVFSRPIDFTGGRADFALDISCCCCTPCCCAVATLRPVTTTA